MINRIIALGALCLSCAAGISHSGSAYGEPRNTSGPPWTAEVSVPSSYRIKFDSGLTGESYTLFIRVPVGLPPPKGYAVIYILDGDAYFGTAGDISLALNGYAPVVVAIGHGLLDDMDVIRRYAGRKPGDQSAVGIADIGAVMNTLRFHDYTLPVAPEHRAPAWTGLTPENVGGLDDFLKVIETEIKPRVAQLVPVDPANVALFGHSIGGLAVLRALFTEPAAFRTFIAASPSIWWDADAVLAGEASFSKLIRSRSVSPRVLISVGADETNPSDIPPAVLKSLPADKAAELQAFGKMMSHWSGIVPGARDLAARLAALPGGPDYKVTFVAFAGETHGTVSPAALNRGMWFAFAP